MVLSTTGVFYYRLGNLTPKFMSSLSSIHLVCIVKAAIIQKYGLDKILEPFMADIKELEKVITSYEQTTLPAVIALNYIITGRKCEISIK